jgi:hypothetical protein
MDMQGRLLGQQNCEEKGEIGRNTFKYFSRHYSREILQRREDPLRYLTLRL